MLEVAWAGLLLLAASHRRTRPLAFVLLLKWGLNYAAAARGAWMAPIIIDFVLGSAVVMFAWRLRYTISAAVLMTAATTTMIVHAWHWGLWAQGIYVGREYYLFVIGLFTAQALALAWPKGTECVRRLIRFLGVYRGSRLADSIGWHRDRKNT